MYYSKINISVHGSSAHGSTPHLGKDAIVTLLLRHRLLF